MARIRRVDIHVVHNYIRTGRLHPVLAAVEGAVQPLRRPRKYRVQIVRVLHQHARAPRGRGNALRLVHANSAAKLRPAVLALIDSRARTEVDHIRRVGIDDDREYVRVVNHSLLDVVSSWPAIGGLPGKMPRSGINCLRIGGIDGDRLHLVDLAAALWADPLSSALPRPCRDRPR